MILYYMEKSDTLEEKHDQQSAISSIEQLAVTDGKWIKYEQGSNPVELVKPLQGHNTYWHIAQEETAGLKLKEEDFYVYYSLDKDGDPTIPRVVIGGKRDQIKSIYGIGVEYNLDSHIVSIVQEKLKEFSNGNEYEKKAEDMKRFSAIENKAKTEEALDKDDLTFLYELDDSIKYFGFQPDPRIIELRGQRNKVADMLVIFECSENQIARSIFEIKENTKAFVGPLVPGIFDVIQAHHIEHIYTSFPEGHIHVETIKIGGKSVEMLTREIREQNIIITDYAREMMKSDDFNVLEESEIAILVRLRIDSLGFNLPKNEHPTTDQIYKRVEELGLELCSAEVAPHYRLQHKNQPIHTSIDIGMKPITVRGERPPYSFSLGRHGLGLELGNYGVKPTTTWGLAKEFVFRFRKKGPLA